MLKLMVTVLKQINAGYGSYFRLLVAADGGRDVNLKYGLEHELSPAPLSCTNRQLFTVGEERKPG